MVFVVFENTSFSVTSSRQSDPRILRIEITLGLSNPGSYHRVFAVGESSDIHLHFLLP